MLSGKYTAFGINFALLLLASLVFAQNKRVFDVNGYEVELKGAHSMNDNLYGLVPMPTSETEIIKYVKGKETVRYKYSINSKGLRTSTTKDQQEKKKHLLLLGGSQVFGENLNDSQTIAYKINEKSKDYEAYSVSFFGYGPQHAWLRLEQNKLNTIVSQKKGTAILFTHYADISRYFGKIEHLPYMSSHPRVIEITRDVFKYIGNFQNSGNFLQSMVLKLCVPYLFCKNLIMGFKSELSDQELHEFARLVMDIEKKYREQFEVEHFILVWSSDVKYVSELKKYTSIEIINYPIQSQFYDGHPKSDAYDELIKVIFAKQIIK